MSVTALALALAIAAQVEDATRFVVDAGPIGWATPSARPDATQLFTGVALRGGARRSFGLLDVGGFARLATTVLPRGDGTSDVGSATHEGLFDVGGEAGLRFAAAPLSIAPHLWTSAMVGGRATELRAFATRTWRASPAVGARVGVGVLVEVAFLAVRLDLGVGLRERGVETTASFGLGGLF